MSRNFELLQNLGKEQEMFGSQGTPLVTESAVPVTQAAEAYEWKPPQLAMEDSQREELEKLVQRVFLIPTADAARFVVFSGTESGVGGSWICARVAEILASQVAGTVCVVDANLRSPGIHHQFGVEAGPGLSDSLLTPEPVQEFFRSLDRRNLFLLSAGTDSENGQALLNSDRLRARLDEVRSQFNYVLVDAPSLSSGNDTVVMGRAADGVVVVLKAHSSRRETVRKTMLDLEEAKVRVLGAVLNQRTFPIPQKIYKVL